MLAVVARPWCASAEPSSSFRRPRRAPRSRGKSAAREIHAGHASKIGVLSGEFAPAHQIEEALRRRRVPSGTRRTPRPGRRWWSIGYGGTSLTRRARSRAHRRVEPGGFSWRCPASIVVPDRTADLRERDRGRRNQSRRPASPRRADVPGLPSPADVPTASQTSACWRQARASVRTVPSSSAVDAPS